MNTETKQATLLPPGVLAWAILLTGGGLTFYFIYLFFTGNLVQFPPYPVDDSRFFLLDTVQTILFLIAFLFNVTWLRLTGVIPSLTQLALELGKFFAVCLALSLVFVFVL